MRLPMMVRLPRGFLQRTFRRDHLVRRLDKSEPGRRSLRGCHRRFGGPHPAARAALLGRPPILPLGKNATYCCRFQLF